jgi:hypothetical protein
MDGTCGYDGRDNECVQNFDVESPSKRPPRRRRRNNIKIGVRERCFEDEEGDVSC